MTLVTSFPTSPSTSPSPTPPPLDRDQALHELGTLTLHMMWALRTRSQRMLEPVDLNPVKALILGFVAESTFTPSELTDMIETAPSMTSSLIGDLENRGLIHRDPDPNDRRKVRLTLTQEGRELLAAVDRLWIDASRDHLAHLDDEELTTLVTLTKKVLRTP